MRGGARSRRSRADRQPRRSRCTGCTRAARSPCFRSARRAWSSAPTLPAQTVRASWRRGACGRRDRAGMRWAQVQPGSGWSRSSAWRSGGDRAAARPRAVRVLSEDVPLFLPGLRGQLARGVHAVGEGLAGRARRAVAGRIGGGGVRSVHRLLAVPDVLRARERRAGAPVRSAGGGGARGDGAGAVGRAGAEDERGGARRAGGAEGGVPEDRGGGGGESDGDGDYDSDWGSDYDSDWDSDYDSDSEIDSDTDNQIDSDTDSEIDSAIDSDSDRGS